MSTTLVNCFFNPRRPRLLYHSGTILPFEILDEDTIEDLANALTLPADSEGHLLATSCRLWESMLKKHHCPYFLLKVADMRMYLGRKSSGLELYEELAVLLKDDIFNSWVTDLRSSISEEVDGLMNLYKADPTERFTPSQRWVPTALDPFPSCTMEPNSQHDLSKIWKDLALDPETNWKDRFLNECCLETNYLEGTFHFHDSDHAILAKYGFFSEAKLDRIEHGPIAGFARNIQDSIAILQDTRNALEEIYTFLEPNPRELTPDVVCSIHKILMKTSQVLYDESRGSANGRLSYVNIGVTRQTSRVNVTVSSNADEKPFAVQFCPYDEVDGELTVFCKRFNEIMRMDDIDPYACAAWIMHVFVTIHPFEDGNGRLSRILSSIPLVRKGLPPVYIASVSQPTYFEHLNNARTRPRSGDYQGLMNFLFTTSRDQLNTFNVEPAVL